MYAYDKAQLPPILTDGVWTVPFEFYGADTSSSLDQTGTTWALTLSPWGAAQPDALDVHTFTTDASGGITINSNVVTVSNADWTGWTPGPYQAELRQTDGANPDVTYVGKVTVARGLSEVASLGGGSALPTNGSAAVQLFTDGDVVRIVRGEAAGSALLAAASATAAGTSETNAAASATLAEAWASKTDGEVAATDYSAKEWSIGTLIRGTAGGGSAKDWATYEGGTVDDTGYSAKHYAALTAADRVQTGQDVTDAQAAQAAAQGFANNAASSAASAASNTTATLIDVMEKVATYDTAATQAQVAATTARGVTNLPAASSGKQYFRIGLLTSTSLTGVASFTRATSRTATDADGSVVSFASGVPAVLRNGVHSHEGTTNKCTNYNANPTDLTGVTLTKATNNLTTLTVVDDSAALAAAGLSGLCTSGKVYKLDNSAGDTSAYAAMSGLTGDANNHVASAYVRTTGAGGTPNFIGFSTSSTPGVTTFGAVSAYTRQSALTSVPGSTLQVTVRAGPGYVVYFILNQLEEKTFATPVQVVAGATATRNPDVIQETVNVPIGQAFTVVGKFIGPATAVSSPAIFELLPAANANDRVLAYCSGGAVRLNNSSNGVAASDPFGGFSDTYTPGAPVGFAISVSGDAVTWSINGAAAHTVTLPGGAFSQALTRLALGCRVIGTQQLDSTIRELRILDRALSAAECATFSDVSLEWDLDFTTQTYKYLGAVYSSITDLPMTTFSRATTATYVTLAGYMLNVSSGALRVGDAGLMIEPQRTNKCTNFNANPNGALFSVSKSGDAAATLTEVDDSAALATAKLNGVCTSGKVFKLDNSAGTTNATAVISGQTGNTNAHALSAYMRGSGQVWIGYTNSPSTEPTENGALTAMTAAYQRLTAILTPTVTTRGLRVGAAPGAVVYFILNQLEEGSYATSAIVVAGATSTRNPDVPASNDNSPSAFTIFAKLTVPFIDSGQAHYAYEWSDGTSANRVLISNEGGHLILYVVNGGTLKSLDLGAVAAGSTYKVAAAFNNNDIAVSVNGAAALTLTTTAIPALNTFRIGSSASASGGAYWGGGGIVALKRWRGRRTNAQLQADAT